MGLITEILGNEHELEQISTALKNNEERANEMARELQDKLNQVNLMCQPRKREQSEPQSETNDNDAIVKLENKIRILGKQVERIRNRDDLSAQKRYHRFNYLKEHI